MGGAQAFLPFSNPDFSDLGSVTYAAGSDLEFTSVAGDLGLAEAAIVTVTLKVTPTIASGNSIKWSPMRSFFNRCQVEQGGETYKDVHPWYWVVRNAINRRLYLPNYANSNYGGDYVASSYAAANLGGAMPALTTATAASVTFQFIIPFRWLRGRLEGCFPIGDSSNPLTLHFFTPKTLYGSDPENNLFLIHPGSSDTVALNSGSVKVVLVYRTALSYTPKVTIATPTVGSQLKVTQSSLALSSVGSEVAVDHNNRFPHTTLITVVEDGNADPNTAGNTLGLMSAADISRFRYILTTKTPVIDLDTDNKMQAFFAGQRLELGFDLPDGVFPYYPLFLEHGAGVFTDPNLENTHQIPDFNVWRNSSTGVTVASGTTLNGSSTGLARIRTFSEMLVGVDY